MAESINKARIITSQVQIFLTMRKPGIKTFSYSRFGELEKMILISMVRWNIKK
jgi:hypothetical protein